MATALPLGLLEKGKEENERKNHPKKSKRLRWMMPESGEHNKTNYLQGYEKGLQNGRNKILFISNNN